MVRPREFDEDHVLDRAVEAFWRKGYEATSVRDLEDATGLNRGSLYGAFGDKERLFLAVLDRYCERFTEPTYGALALSPSPRTALVALFQSMPEQLTRTANPRGCLVASTCAEAPPEAGAITRKASACLARLESLLYAAVRRMQALNEIDPHRDPRALARFLTGAVQGMAVMAKVTDDMEMLRDIATIATEVLGPPGEAQPV